MSCTDDESTNGNSEESNEKEIIEKVIEKKSAEQYLEEFENTPDYQESIQGTEVGFLEAVDFEGDEVPEMVQCSNVNQTHSKVTIYKLEKEKWIEVTAFEFESDMDISLGPIGKLTYEDGTLKEALAFSKMEALATSISRSISILDYNDDTQTIEELVTIPLQSKETYSESLEENKITVFAEDGYAVNYIFKNGELVDNEGNRLGMIIDEELSKLTGTTMNDYYISLTDSYSVAQGKIKESLKSEEYYEGAMCSFYETFFICDYHKENGGMHAFYITPKNEVTVDETTSVFDQKLEVKEWENMMEGGYSYTAEVKTETGLYSLQFNGDSPDSVLEFIAYIPD